MKNPLKRKNEPEEKPIVIEVEPERPNKVTVEPGHNNNYHWVERAPNGEITGCSEVFNADTRVKSKAQAIRAAKDHVAAQRVFVEPDGDA